MFYSFFIQKEKKWHSATWAVSFAKYTDNLQEVAPLLNVSEVLSMPLTKPTEKSHDVKTVYP